MVQSNRLIKLLPYISCKLFISQLFRINEFLRKYGVRHHRYYFTTDTRPKTAKSEALLAGGTTDITGRLV